MTQGSNSTGTLDRLPGMQEGDLRRKIPVEKVVKLMKVSTRKEERDIRLYLAEDAQQTHRAELANIRWRLKGKSDTKGTSWDLTMSALKQYGEYFEFQEPLDILIERAKQELKERMQKEKEDAQTRQQRMREEALQCYQELRTRHVPNPSQVKVRVVYCECDEPYLYRRIWLNEDAPKVYEIRIELDREGMPQELEARKQLAKLFTEDKKKYHVKGVGYSWRMDEHTLRAYSDWLILPCVLEEEIARWEREGERQPEYKIKIKNIYNSGMDSPSSDGYCVEFDYCEIDSVLRKAIRTYRHKYQSSANRYYLGVDTSGHIWTLTEDILLFFELWFDLSEPMSALLDKARKRAEQIRREKSSRYDFNPFSSFRRESDVESALQLFNLDRPVTQDDVKKKYRQLAKQCHPDTGGNEEEFKRLNQANQVLMQHFA